ncbi:hypothetical protein IQ283_12055 [Alkalihalobacillus hwajinpoensis]|uniref:hypothetical protein n=1 Tax=Guptibacillus hwajinpoensis TaxID=208199 RepID=UPI00188403CC|nr:hypothetical protein [Pseudalkalibacillus hwajinpoensis]MBF0707321.1 hypothetical protein [Pseudalkalibacillus hwajinpoensis]
MKKGVLFTLTLSLVLIAILLIFLFEDDRAARPGMIMSLGALAVVFQRVVWLVMKRKKKNQKRR